MDIYCTTRYRARLVCDECHICRHVHAISVSVSLSVLPMGRLYHGLAARHVQRLVTTSVVHVGSARNMLSCPTKNAEKRCSHYGQNDANYFIYLSHTCYVLRILPIHWTSCMNSGGSLLLKAFYRQASCYCTIFFLR